MADSIHTNTMKLHQQFAQEILNKVDTENKVLKGEVAQGSPRRQANKRSIPITNLSQVVMPSISWDWPVAKGGTLCYEQIRLSDYIPQSMNAGEEYAASEDSFSCNYRSFLDFIDAGKFPAPALLSNAKEMIKKPMELPSTSAGKEGWTKVNKAGVDRWAPIWSLSDTASYWADKVRDGSISNAGSFTLKLKEPSAPILLPIGQKSPEINEPKFRKLIVSAQAWGQITITPGAWFNSSLIKLGKDYVQNPDDFFGLNGLLRGRVSSILVASKPHFEFQQPVAEQGHKPQRLLKGAKLHALGVPVEVTNKVDGTSNATPVKLASTSERPVIVAVILEKLIDTI